MHTLILGLGNPLRGDDGVGTAVIANLRNHPDLPPDVDLVDGGTAGLETAVHEGDHRQSDRGSSIRDGGTHAPSAKPDPIGLGQ